MTITCADCGSTQILDPLPPRGIAECHRCDRLLDRHRWTRFDLSLVSAIATLLLLPPAVILPLMQSTVRNLFFDQSRLISSVPEIYKDVWFPFAFGFLFLAFIFPVLQSLFLIVVLGSIRWNWGVGQRGRYFRWYEELRPWSMPDVVAIAGVVAYMRAAIPGEVDVLIGAYIYCLAAFLAVLADKSLDRRDIWAAIYPDPDRPPPGPLAACPICEMTVLESHPGPCPRCSADLKPDVTLRFVLTASALAATIPLFGPSFSFAIIVNDRITGVWEHTVIGTIQLLADWGYWHFGLILLAAGVLIPLFALFSMIWLLARVRFPSKSGLVRRTRVVRALRRLVRWPMIIPFIAAVAAPIVDFRNLDDILAGPGATPFFALVVLIMLAVRLFEPRLMWEAAGEGA